VALFDELASPFMALGSAAPPRPVAGCPRRWLSEAVCRNSASAQELLLLKVKRPFGRKAYGAMPLFSLGPTRDIREPKPLTNLKLCILRGTPYFSEMFDHVECSFH
jgi:hypothetical protein